MQEGPEFRHLTAFVTVAEECNFGKAAQRLHITQPALSSQIKQLESWLGASLFKRVPYGAELTETGRNFLLYARRILHMRQHALKAASRKHSEEEWPLHLGYSPFVNHKLIEEALLGYHEIVPEGHISSLSDCTAKLTGMMEDGRLDAAIVTLPISAKGLFEHRICEEKVLLCLRRDDPFASAKEIPKEAIAARLRILFSRDYHPALYDEVLRKFKTAGIELRPTETYSAPAEMQFLVKTLHCFGLVREQVPLDPELTVRLIPGMDLRYRTALICHCDQQRPVFPMLAYRMAQRCAGERRMASRKSPGHAHIGQEQLPFEKAG
jgi:DNA-binding transcriptional LysR family regulator